MAAIIGADADYERDVPAAARHHARDTALEAAGATAAVGVGIGVLALLLLPTVAGGIAGAALWPAHRFLGFVLGGVAVGALQRIATKDRPHE